MKLGLCGAGLMGRQHARAISQTSGVSLGAVADPAGAAFAQAEGVPHFNDLQGLLTSGCDGIILALPNAQHMDAALQVIDAGIPVLVEKPLARTAAEGKAIVRAAVQAGVPVLTGHHRRHSPVMRKAKSLIDDGVLGQITAVHGQVWLLKPDDYFDVPWRRAPGAGPVLVNLIHDIDLMQYLLGPVEAVQAMASTAPRDHAVEATATVLLRFQSGVLATLNASDTALSPWSWELTARENPAYPATDENCYFIAGTHGALALPNLALWQNTGKRGWWEPISSTRMPVPHDDPLVAQIAQFADVIRGAAPPLVSAEDGLAALEVAEAVLQAAATGAQVSLGPRR